MASLGKAYRKGFVMTDKEFDEVLHNMTIAQLGRLTEWMKKTLQFVPPLWFNDDSPATPDDELAIEFLVYDTFRGE